MSKETTLSSTMRMTEFSMILVNQMVPICTLASFL